MDLVTPSDRVIEAVAQKEGVSPVELFPRLFDVIDPDALDALVQAAADSNSSRVKVEFRCRDYIVRVQNTPTVDVSIRKEGSPTATSPSVEED